MSKTTKWRLAKLPTPDEVALLLDKGIITKEEARAILISQETDEDRDKKSLQDEVKFLRELVQKLSNNSRTEIVRQIEYIEKPYRRYDWYEPYKFYCSSSTNQLYSGTGTTTATVNLNVNDQQLTNAAYVLSEPDFTAIKTF